jgi:hypothetical protein
VDYQGLAIELVRGLVCEMIGRRGVCGLEGRNGECARDMGLLEDSVFKVG